jgi:hypothetical protein
MQALRKFICAFLTGITMCVAASAAPEDPYVGRWALTIPGGRAGWLGVSKESGQLSAHVLWGGGSVVPVDKVYMDGDTLVVERLKEIERKDASGKVIAKDKLTETIKAKASGDTLSLEHIPALAAGVKATAVPFTGKRIPDIPPAPDLSKVKFGEPIALFNEKDLSGWKLINERDANGWSVKDGALVNDPVDKKSKSYGNLRTEKQFEDFNLKLDVNVVPHGNSGIYLRGIYEVQVEDTFGQPAESHHMGAIYSRIAPTTPAEKRAGEWQSMDITLCDRHITVILNGTKIIDNQPLLGCTGGAMWSDESKPGPIYLQGDHGGVSYRKIVLTPIVK